jgi:Fe-S cluster biosynthesis and repair protein YggX
MEIACRRCGQRVPGLDQAPLPGKWGSIVQAQTCPACWSAWVEEQTRLINHEHLLPADAAHRQVLYQKMREFLDLRD